MYHIFPSPKSFCNAKSTNVACGSSSTRYIQGHAFSFERYYMHLLLKEHWKLKHTNPFSSSQPLSVPNSIHIYSHILCYIFFVHPLLMSLLSFNGPWQMLSWNWTREWRSKRTKFDPSNTNRVNSIMFGSLKRKKPRFRFYLFNCFEY